MKNKDWTGNSNIIFRTLGSSNHVEAGRAENDYYATDPYAIDLLFAVHHTAYDVWEPACGEGHLSKRMEKLGRCVKSTDLIYRGYGEGNVDFLNCTTKWAGDIITNPPYSLAKEFIERALSLVSDGNQVIMFLKVQFLEGKARKALFTRFPPKIIYVSSSRIACAKNGDFDGLRTSGGSAVAYAWYIWEKGFTGNPTIKWIN